MDVRWAISFAQRTFSLIFAVVAELADAHGSGPCGKPWGFESLRPHQNDIGNCFSPTTIVAAVTAKQTKKELPVHLAISAHMLHADSTLLLEQIRTIDKCRLKGYLGSVSEKEMRDIDRVLKLSIGLAGIETVRKKYSRKYI